MSLQYSVTSTAWVAITNKGESRAAWLDEENDGVSGKVDVRIFHSSDGVPTSGNISEAKKIYKPSGNNDTMVLSASNENDIYYARCVNEGDTAIISVDNGIGYQNSVDVALQDQTTPDIILRMNKALSTFVLAAIQTVNQYILTVQTGHTAVAGDFVCLQQWDSVFEIPRFFQASIIVANADNFELDRPIDFAFDPAKVLGQNITRVNMAGEVGTIGTPVIYAIGPLVGKWDITRLLVQVFTAGTMDDGKFGSIAALTHGLTIRTNNDFLYNSFNVKSNGAWASIAYDTKYADKPPAGTGNGFSSRLTFAGQNKIGVVKRLDSATGDKLEVVIPDDLSAFGVGDTYIITAEGHVVKD